MLPRLVVTDGTDELDLLQLPGFQLEGWRPSISGYKGGGVYQQSPLSDGRRLVDRRFDNSFETFRFKAKGVSQDELIQSMQNMRRMLEKAANYWATDWQDEPVWIEARASEETNLRYGLIVQGRIPEDENPFAQPFLQPLCEAVMDRMTLVVERTHWTENQPGTGTAVEISALEAYDGRNLGNVNAAGVRTPTIADEVYIANKRNEANLTDVYYWDSAAPAWSGNLMDAGLPFDLFQNPVAAGDFILFGIDVAGSPAGVIPFDSLVFDLLTVQNDLTIVWRYSETSGARTADPTDNAGGGANPWPVLVVQDNTNQDGVMGTQAFDTAGVRSVHWVHPADWDSVNAQVIGVGPAVGVTCFWVCAHVTAVGATPTPPEQQNRDIYSIVWPYVEVQAAAVGGDIPAIAQITLPIQSDRDGGVNPVIAWTDRVIVGLRSVSRGANFTAFINFSDEQNPVNITVNDPGPGVFTTELSAQCATGRMIAVTNPGANVAGASITIDYPLTLEYHGKFHAFIRAFQSSGAVGDVEVQLIARSSTTIAAAMQQSNWIPFTRTLEMLDFGVFTLNTAGCEDSAELFFQVRFDGDGTADVNVYDLILIPVDEWAADCVDFAKSIGSTGSTIRERQGADHTYLDINGISCVKTPGAILRFVANDRKLIRYQYIANGSPVVQENARQRLWFVSAYWNVEAWSHYITPAYIVNVSRNQQYLSMRGAR